MNDPMSERVIGKPIEEGVKLVAIRMKRLKEAYDQLLRAGRRNSLIATIIRIFIIVLGAFMGIRGAIEQQMRGNSEAGLSGVVMTFTIIGFSIAVLGAIEQAFKFEQKGAALNALAQKAQSRVSYFMRLDAAPERKTYEGFWELAKEQDEDFDVLSKEALQAGLTLKVTAADFL